MMVGCNINKNKIIFFVVHNEHIISINFKYFKYDVYLKNNTLTGF